MLSKKLTWKEKFAFNVTFQHIVLIEEYACKLNLQNYVLQSITSSDRILYDSDRVTEAKKI